MQLKGPASSPLAKKNEAKATGYGVDTRCRTISKT
jgi:hypothetical protein